MTAGMFVGWLAGLVVGCVISVSVTSLLHFGSDVAFLFGLVVGLVCSSVGMWIGADA